MNKKLITALIATGVVATIFSSSAQAATYSGSHTGYGAAQTKDFTLSSSGSIEVSGTQYATAPGAEADCYYYLYKKVSFWFDELLDSDQVTGNNVSVSLYASNVSSGNYYLKFVCNSPSYTSGTISW